MRFDKLPENFIDEIQLGAGCLATTFSMETESEFDKSNILGASTGGINFSAVPSNSNLGNNIDNCPPNVKEFERIDYYTVQCTGNFVSMNNELAERTVGAADISGNKITPRAVLKSTDFKDLWLLCDYSSKNGALKGGLIAIHMLNTLSTGGFQIQTTNRDKGTFAFTFKAYYSLENPEQVPFEIYIKVGEEES